MCTTKNSKVKNIWLLTSTKLWSWELTVIKGLKANLISKPNPIVNIIEILNHVTRIELGSEKTNFDYKHHRNIKACNQNWVGIRKN